MKTINLRWMYPHYRHDEFVDVTDEVWAAMYQAQREMENYERLWLPSERDHFPYLSEGRTADELPASPIFRR